VNTLPDLSCAADIRYGVDPILDAWLLHFMTENNLEYRLTPHVNATPEQLRFMVDLEEGQVYVPCSDEMFEALYRSRPGTDVRAAYNVAWRVLVRMVREHITTREDRLRIIQFSRHRFRLGLVTGILIPSRMMKRLASIFRIQSGVLDPYRARKILYNRRAQELIWTHSTDQQLNACPVQPLACTRLDDLRWELDLVQLKRLFVLSTRCELWREANAPDPGSLDQEVEESGDCMDYLRAIFGPDRPLPANVLYLPDSSGGVIVDLLIIRMLLRQGHRVILALKGDFYFQAPTIWDLENDPILARAVAGAKVLTERSISKNELLRLLREHRFLVISDGTNERLNLYRTSVTFARAWKEADVIIAKGVSHHRRLIGTSHHFTRDVLCFLRGPDGRFGMHFKPKSQRAVKFTEADLQSLADAIIATMQHAHGEGKKVMFYSAVVGSIPGQTKTAIKVLHTFVAHLRSRLEGTFVINPAEHFIAGMDGDDLMYMWERVQRSGLIDVWRFQTVEDIEASFELMGQRVPPAWTGKDSTFSTGCTKEMHIALDEQRRHPELQIIGPSAEKFFRRAEYGVGKYFDVGINPA
jgi:uncharacterized protein with ATP-grasp and redox domains